MSNPYAKLQVALTNLSHWEKEIGDVRYKIGQLEYDLVKATQHANAYLKEADKLIKEMSEGK